MAGCMTRAERGCLAFIHLAMLIDIPWKAAAQPRGEKLTVARTIRRRTVPINRQAAAWAHRRCEQREAAR
jgi:hypothetical protein